MKQRERVTSSRKNTGSKTRAKLRGRKTATGRGISLMASVEGPTRSNILLEEFLGLYKPLKKPITLRLDADVLAWFKKDGRRYQTRINGALRKVMEREMKEAGK